MGYDHYASVCKPLQLPCHHKPQVLPSAGNFFSMGWLSVLSNEICIIYLSASRIKLTTSSMIWHHFFELVCARNCVGEMVISIICVLAAFCSFSLVHSNTQQHPEDPFQYEKVESLLHLCIPFYCGYYALSICLHHWLAAQILNEDILISVTYTVLTPLLKPLV